MGNMVDNVLIYQNPDGSVQLEGELNYSNVSNIYRETADLFKQSRNSLEIDLAGVTRTDSAGLALLVEWLSEARSRNLEINFKNAPEQMLEMVKMSSLDRVLPIT